LARNHGQIKLQKRSGRFLVSQQKQSAPQPQGNNARRRSGSGGRFQQRRPNPQAPAAKQQAPLSNGDQLLVQYDRLLEQHVEARKKLHEQFYRVDLARLDKLEKKFDDTLRDLRAFEKQLKPWQEEKLRNYKTEFYPLDAEYSQNYASEEEVTEFKTLKGPQAQLATSVRGVNFHTNEVQVKRESYAADVEDSAGTYEDYLKYKNSL
jgi:hypothetical protein